MKLLAKKCHYQSLYTPVAIAGLILVGVSCTNIPANDTALTEASASSVPASETGSVQVPTQPVESVAPEEALVSKKRNVILFLGDGMGVSTVTAARIFAGQQLGASGEEHQLQFESFPDLALIKTYTTDFQVPDSAGTMTAIMTGEKTRSGFINVDSSVERDDCAASLAQPLRSLLVDAEEAGYATGIISTASITHATPAATYASVPNRDWENDSRMPAAAIAAGCTDIASQLSGFSAGDGIDVIFGGGRAHFYPTVRSDPEYPDKSGARVDGRDLVAEWLAAADNRQYIWDGAQFDDLVFGKQTQVLGLFEPSHMQFEADRIQDPGVEPSLARLTDFALHSLSQRSDKGYFLMVEAGRIDHGHHGGNALRALTDTLALDRAVKVALQHAAPAETLIVVTADHSHTLTISGYPARGNPILGKARLPDGSLLMDANKLPYTTLGYANGPGAEQGAPDITEIDTSEKNYRQRAAVPLSSETHAGEDVAAYAQGPNSAMIGGVMEQNEIYDAMHATLFGKTFDKEFGDKQAAAKSP